MNIKNDMIQDRIYLLELRNMLNQKRLPIKAAEILRRMGGKIMTPKLENTVH